MGMIAGRTKSFHGIGSWTLVAMAVPCAWRDDFFLCHRARQLLLAAQMGWPELAGPPPPRPARLKPKRPVRK